MDHILVKTLINFLHILTTTLWIGGMIVNTIIIRPALNKTLDDQTRMKVIRVLMGHFRIMVYGCIVLLGVTGIPLKIIHPGYTTPFALNTTWEVVSLIKHLFYGVLVLVAVYNFEVVYKKMPEAYQTGTDADRQRWSKRLWITGILGATCAVTILALSAAMRYI